MYHATQSLNYNDARHITHNSFIDQESIGSDETTTWPTILFFANWRRRVTHWTFQSQTSHSRRLHLPPSIHLSPLCLPAIHLFSQFIQTTTATTTIVAAGGWCKHQDNETPQKAVFCPVFRLTFFDVYCSRAHRAASSLRPDRQYFDVFSPLHYSCAFTQTFTDAGDDFPSQTGTGTHECQDKAKLLCLWVNASHVMAAPAKVEYLTQLFEWDPNRGKGHRFVVILFAFYCRAHNRTSHVNDPLLVVRYCFAGVLCTQVGRQRRFSSFIRFPMWIIVVAPFVPCVSLCKYNKLDNVL